MIGAGYAAVLAQLLFVGVAGGLIFLRAPRLLRLPAFSRGLVGVCLTPFVIAAFTLLVAFLWPGAGRVVYLIPLAASLVVIWRLRRTLAWSARRVVRKAWDSGRQWEVLAIRAGASAALIWLLLLVVGNSLQPVVGHDALIYFNEAKAFSSVRSPSAVPDFTGEPGEVIATHPHTFFYQAYIANAFIVGSATLAPPDDLGARIASQATVLFLFLGVLALGGAARTRGVASLGLLLTIGVTAFGYLSHHDSRDGFRILSLIVLVLSLIPIAGCARQPRTREYLLPAMGAALAIYAHTLNILFLGVLGLGVIVVAAMTRTGFARLLKIGLAVGVGAMIPGVHYLQSWLDTASVLGHGMYYPFYRGTPLWDAFVAQADWSQADNGFAGALWGYAKIYGYAVTAGGVLASLMIAITPALRRSGLIAWFFLLGLALPLSGVFDSGGVGIRQAMLANLRYPLVIYPFACVALAATLLFLARRYLHGFTARAIRLDRLLIAVAALVASLGALQSLDRWTHRTWAPAYVADNYLSLALYLDAHLGPDESWATDLYAAAYYAPRQPLFLFSKQGSGLFQTVSQAEVRRLLGENRIRVVALRNDIETWWAGTVFLRVLEDDATDQVRMGFWTVYLLNR